MARLRSWFVIMKFLKALTGSILLLAILFVWVSPANAAVSIDTSTTGTQGNTNSTTFAFTVSGSCANPVLIVAVSSEDSVAADQVITGVTFNSDSLTNIRTDTEATRRSEMWQIAPPDTGSSFNIVVSYTGFVARKVYGAASFCGVDQVSPIEDHDGTTGTTGDPSLTLTASVPGTTIVDNIAVDGLAGLTLTADGSQTEMWDAMLDNQIAGSASRLDLASSGNQSVGYAISSDFSYGYSAVMLRPSEVPASLPVPDLIINNGIFWINNGTLKLQ